CAEVIIISYSNPEYPDCDPARRKSWLTELFPSAHILIPTDVSLKLESIPEIPRNDADPVTHRRFCAFLCTQILGVTVDAVFTSENYGDGFAAELTRHFREENPTAPEVQHVLVDQRRQAVPISGALLREDIHANRGWLSPNVYRSFVHRACMLGGESSGKTTL